MCASCRAVATATTSPTSWTRRSDARRGRACSTCATGSSTWTTTGDVACTLASGGARRGRCGRARRRSPGLPSCPGCRIRCASRRGWSRTRGPPAGSISVEPDGDVLVVGTGLTMVDAVRVLDRPGRVIHATSRHGVLPHAARRRPAARHGGARAALGRRRPWPSCTRSWTAHIDKAIARYGDWRPAIDSIRAMTAAAVGRSQRRRPRRVRRARRPAMGRRTPPHPAGQRRSRWSRPVRRTGSCCTPPACSMRSRPTDGVDVTLSDGTTVRVSAVVNCAGPCGDPGDEHRPAGPVADRPWARAQRAAGDGLRHHRRRRACATRSAAPRSRCGRWGRCAAARCGRARRSRRSVIRRLRWPSSCSGRRPRATAARATRTTCRCRRRRRPPTPGVGRCTRSAHCSGGAAQALGEAVAGRSGLCDRSRRTGAGGPRVGRAGRRGRVPQRCGRCGAAPRRRA